MSNTWRKVKVSDVARVVGGSTPSTSDETFWNGDIPWLTPKDLSDRPSRYTSGGSRFISRKGLDSCSTTLVPEGTVLLTSRAPIGYVSIAKQPLSTNQGFKNLVLNDNQDPLFWYYLLRGSKDYLESQANGSTFKEISGNVLKNLNFIVPDLEEQRRISGVLGALDDMIEANQRVMKDLDDLGMALFRSGWDGQTWISISEIGEVLMGQSPPGSSYNEAGIGTVFYQGVRDFGDRYPSKRVHCTEPTRVADAGDALIAVRAPIGDTNVAVEPTAIGRGVAALKSPQPSLALRALRASKLTWAAHQGTGTVFSSISGPELRKAKVPDVRDPELEATLSELDVMHLSLWTEINSLIATRNQLLPILVSGRAHVSGDRAA